MSQWVVNHRERLVAEDVVRFEIRQGQPFLGTTLQEARDRQEGMDKAGGWIDVERELERRSGCVDLVCRKVDHRRLPMRAWRKGIERNGLPHQLESHIEAAENPRKACRRHHGLG